MGPAQRVVGGQLTFAYNDKPGKLVKLDKSLDSAEMLRQYGTGRRPNASQAEQDEAQAAGDQGLQHSQSERAGQAKGPAPRKLVFWDGLQHHVIDAPPSYKGSPSVDRQSSHWRAPHLEHKCVLSWNCTIVQKV